MEYALNVDLGIDQFLFRDPYSSIDPGRISPITCVGLILLGPALALMKARAEWARRIARGLALMAGALGTIALLGYSYDTHALYQVRAYSSVAVHTAVAFVIAALGVESANPTEGIIRHIRADSAGGAMLRQLLPAALFIPYLLGLAVWSASKRLGWEAGFALALLVAGTMSCLVIVMLLNAKRLEREDLARREVNRALERHEQQLRVLAGSLLTAQEDERRRLSRELHDDITQRLAFLSIQLGKLALEVPSAWEGVQARLRELQEQTQDASTEVRRLSHGLHPSVIEDFGLGVALEEFCSEFEKAQGIHVRFDGLIDDARLNDTSAACLYRVAQEAVRNATVHGHATEVRVTLTRDLESVQLRVVDNGGGFSMNGAGAKTGLGLVSMRERVRLVNGALRLSSRPGAGTEVIATVPFIGVGHEENTYSRG